MARRVHDNSARSDREIEHEIDSLVRTFFPAMDPGPGLDEAMALHALVGRRKHELRGRPPAERLKALREWLTSLGYGERVKAHGLYYVRTTAKETV